MLSNIFNYIGYFIMGYPLMMAVIWTVCGLLFWKKNEKTNLIKKTNFNKKNPSVTILIPCHNESQTISKTCEALLDIDYPKYKVIFIDDASNDNTSDIIREWINISPKVHLLRINENQGKSNALNNALAVAGNTPITVVMDADTICQPDTISILVNKLESSKNVGAVTGHPIVNNRNNLLEKLQTVEFTSIIGLIKRAQNYYGNIFSISGCITAFKTEALFRVGGFSSRTATEDIDITWCLQKSFYKVEYIPQAVAYIQVPNKLKDFWKQRQRWALGGWHLLRTHKNVLLKWKWKRLWIIYFDLLLSYIWSLLFIFGIIIWIITTSFHIQMEIDINPLPSYASIIILICLIQFFVAIKINSKYDKKIWKLTYLVTWYPIIYFLVGSLSVCSTSIKGIFKSLEFVGKWNSPARINIKK